LEKQLKNSGSRSRGPRIGAYGVEKIYQLDVEDIREEFLRPAEIMKHDTRAAATILSERFSLN